MKNIFYLIISLLLCAILAGGVLIITQDNTETSDSSHSESVTDSTDFWGSEEESNSSSKPNDDPSDSGGEDSSGTENGGETNNLPTLKGLKIPTNESSFIADGLEMQKGAQLSKTSDRALRFTANISKALYDEVMSNENKAIAFLVFPTSYYDKVNVNDYTYMDWIKAFDAAGETSYKYHVLTESDFTASGINYVARYQMSGISYEAVNQKVTCLAVLETMNANGTKTYKYASLPAGETYQSNGRSLAYLAAASLNANRLGLETFTSEEVALFKGYINESVDKAKGQAESTNDDSMYAFTVKPAGPKTLSVGEYFTLETTISPDVETPIWYRSSDESIVEVDDNGVVTAMGKGTAVIGVYVAGETIGVTVTVS